MRTIPGKRIITIALRGVRGDLDAAFKSVAERATGILVGSSRPDGTIDPRYAETVQTEIGNLVQRLFVGNNYRSSFGADGVSALAPIPAMLNKWYVYTVYAHLTAHRNWMQKNMPADLFNRLANTRGGDTSPLGEIVREQNEFLRRDGESDDAYRERIIALRIFTPNPNRFLDPNRQWVPMHVWNDPNGYRLSDRIWQNSVRTRMKVDALLAEGIREGRGALPLSRQLEQFLLPSRALLRTHRPYGTDASFDAMRLARTEIARASNQAAFMSSYLNPYVDQIDAARSPQGDPTCPICPDHATIGIGGERIRPSYSIHDADYPPWHPNCKCYVTPVVTDSPEAVTARLRAMLDRSTERLLAPLTPAAQDLLMTRMIGTILMNLLPQVRQLPLL